MRLNVSAAAKWFDRASQRIGSYVSDALHESVIDARTHARTTTAYKSHTYGLRGSINNTITGAFSERLSATAPYARFVEYGTKPHVIEPRRKKFLRFVIDGTVIFAKRVYHPGSRGRFYMRDAAAYARPKLVARIAKAVGRL